MCSNLSFECWEMKTWYVSLFSIFKSVIVESWMTYRGTPNDSESRPVDKQQQIQNIHDLRAAKKKPEMCPCWEASAKVAAAADATASAAGAAAADTAPAAGDAVAAGRSNKQYQQRGQQQHQQQQQQQ